MIINAAYIIIILILLIIQYFERKDLYNRIMSKNLTEYKGESAPYHISAHTKVLNRWKDKGGDREE